MSTIQVHVQVSHEELAEAVAQLPTAERDHFINRVLALRLQQIPVLPQEEGLDFGHAQTAVIVQRQGQGSGVRPKLASIARWQRCGVRLPLIGGIVGFFLKADDLAAEQDILHDDRLIALFAACFGRLGALAVDDRGTGFAGAARLYAHLFAQVAIDVLPGVIRAP